MEKDLLEVMTTQEAVKYLRISRKTLLKLVHDGEIPARKVGKNYRYLKSEIDHFLKGPNADPREINYFQ